MDVKSYQLAIVTDDGIFTSRHYFLDDEDTAEIAADLWERSESVENFGDLEQAVAEFVEKYEYAHVFDKDAFYEKHENPEDFTVRELPEGEVIAFLPDGDWYADFVVVRNLTDMDFTVTDLNGKFRAVCLESGYSLALSGGAFYAGSGEDIDRRNFIAEFENLKEHLWDDNSAAENYSLIWNLCADYDNDHRDGLYLTDTVSEFNFVDDEFLGDYIENVLAKDPSMPRIRNFIGDTYDDYLYSFDDYGNLKNVNQSDFEEVICEVQRKITDAIMPRLSRQAERNSGESCL